MALSPNVTLGARIAFLSSPIGVNGLAAMDNHCQVEAANASLPGTYLAALATPTTTIASRFFETGTGWARVDGTGLTETTSAMFDFAYRSFLSQTADGTYLASTDVMVWTGGEARMLPTTGASCDGWASTSGNQAVIGDPYLADPSRIWREPGGSVACNLMHRLVCLQE